MTTSILLTKTVMMMPRLLVLARTFTLVVANFEVSTWGPTQIPGFTRPQGFLLDKCPNAFPYPFHGGKKCCRSIMKEDDTGLASDCDGGKIKFHSSEACCWKGLNVDCSDQELGCNTAEETCQPKPTVIDSDPIHNDDLTNFDPAYTLDFVQCEQVKGIYHLAPDSQTNHKIVYDFGCEVAIEQVIVRNTVNRGWNDRATKDITVETSYDLNTWTLLASVTLPSPFTFSNCEMPMHTYDLRAHGRFFRVTLVSYYGAGSGINYITWKFMT